MFLGPDGVQYMMIPEEGWLDGPFLFDGETWADLYGPQSVPDSLRPERYRRSVHEAGHALACVLAGVKVEYVHTLTGRSGMVRPTDCAGTTTTSTTSLRPIRGAGTGGSCSPTWAGLSPTANT